MISIYSRTLRCWRRCGVHGEGRVGDGREVVDEHGHRLRLALGEQLQPLRLLLLDPTRKGASINEVRNYF